MFDPTDLTGDVYRIKNFVTGKYLHSVGSDVVESDNGTNQASNDKEWEFVKSGDYYNINSKRSDRGILRAAGNPPNDIINTGFSAPNSDADKQFTVIYNSTNGTYQFQTRSGSNYIYHNVNGIIEHVSNSDDRSRWIVESTTLSTNDVDANLISVKVYPNPARGNFTIVLKGLNKADVLISDMLGKTVYRNTTTSGLLEITRDGKFTSGMYFIQVKSEGKSYHTKLVIK